MIKLVKHKASWKKEFAVEKEQILSLIDKWTVDIEHIGSTAIKGVCSKPIIDIMVGINALVDADSFCLEPLKLLGYEYLPAYEAHFPERRYFEKQKFHIHLVEYRSSFWQRHLFFRNYLISHPKIAKQYEDLKLSISKDANLDEYTIKKSTFIRSIERLSLS